MHPLNRVAILNNNTAGDQVVLAGDSNKYRIITGYFLSSRNDAGTAATQIYIQVTDYWTGAVYAVDAVNLTANAVNSDKSRQHGLCIPVMPGKDIMLCEDAAPAWKMLTLFYVEIAL